MKVSIVIPERKEFPGYWALGIFFLAGTHPVEVTEAQLAELKADPVLKVLDGSAEEVVEAKPAKKVK